MHFTHYSTTMARTKRVDRTPLPTPRTRRDRAASQEETQREASHFSEAVFDSQEHYERSKKVFPRGVVHERRIRFSRLQPDYMRERLEELRWLFMYNKLDCINVTLVREFYSNFSSVNQQTVFMRGKHIPFIEGFLHDFLGASTGRQPIKHHTTFSMNMALLIYTLINGGKINLARIILDYMYHAAMGPSDQRLPFPLLITGFAAAFEVVPSPEDEYLTKPGKDHDCPFGDWRGEKKKAHKGDIAQPPPPPIPPLIHEPQAPPPSAASSSTAPASDPVQKIIKMLRRQERMLIDTQYMIPTANPNMEFPDLL
ncbi:hypothetical protein PIB30_057934 [Stylosanthes scabra]|uniref:Uncharacterized protein n=1 Tax=Stylosanthes scabra TaxID=79078 RepID=A0ABU6UKC0_9FABA|nr:hypothetical protein [Stylosanthes scabra]